MTLSTSLVESLTAALKQEPKVVAAWLFGSQATGRAGADSDIDIGILCSSPLDWDHRLDLAARLEGAAGGDVDIIDVAAADPILAFEAVSGRRLFVEDQGRTAIAVSLIAREYETAMDFIKRGLEYRRELFR